MKWYGEYSFAIGNPIQEIVALLDEFDSVEEFTDYLISKFGWGYVQSIPKITIYKAASDILNLRRNLLPETIRYMASVDDIALGIKPIGIDFSKRSDNVKHEIKYDPSTNAQRTIHWFMYGRRFLAPPKHWNCKCSLIILENEEDFKHEYECSFEPDERESALSDRILKYYETAIYSINPRDHEANYVKFKKWCDERGYTQEEINRVKRSIRQ